MQNPQNQNVTTQPPIPEITKDKINSTTTSQANSVLGSKGSKTMYMLVIGLFIMLVLTVIAIIVVYYWKIQAPKTTTTPQITVTKGVEVTPETTEFVYYIKANDIYQYNIKTKQSLQISNFSLDPKLFAITDLQIIDDQTLAYFLIDLYTTDDKLMQFDLITKTESVYLVIDEGQLAYFTWIDKSQLISLVTASGNLYTDIVDNKLIPAGEGDFLYVNYYDNGDKVKSYYTHKYAPNRGVAYEDDGGRILFSADGETIIVELTGGEILDQNIMGSSESHSIIILNRYGILITELENAFMPNWLDQTNLLYYNPTLNKFYTYNLENNISLEFDFGLDMRGTYGLRKDLNSNKFVYWKPGKEVYLYDLDTKVNSKLNFTGTEPLFVDSQTIMTTSIVNCNTVKTDCNHLLSDYGYYIYNLEDQSLDTILNEDDDLQNFVAGQTKLVYWCNSELCQD